MLAYEMPLQPVKFRQQFAGQLDYVGAIAGNIVYQAPNGRGSFLSPGRMRDLNSRYLQEYTHNPYARAYARVRPGDVVLGNSMVDLAAVEPSPFYSDICKPENINNQLFTPHASLHEPGGIGGVGLFFSRCQDDNATESLKRLKQLAPHIERAIDLSLHIRRLDDGLT